MKRYLSVFTVGSKLSGFPLLQSNHLVDQFKLWKMHRFGNHQHKQVENPAVILVKIAESNVFKKVMRPDAQRSLSVLM